MSHGPSPNLFVSLDQFLDGIISLFITLQFLSNAFHFFSVLPFAAGFFAGVFLVSGLARGFAAAFAGVLAAGFLAGAFFFAVFFGVSASSPSAGAAPRGFFFFWPGATLWGLFLGRGSVSPGARISSRYTPLPPAILVRPFFYR